MITQRTWTRNDFMKLIAGHPLMRQLAIGVVWSTQAGKKQCFFRVAEDGTLADVRDSSLALNNSEVMSIAHPIVLTNADKKSWSAVFADYEIIQPFEQLARVTFDKREKFASGRRLSSVVCRRSSAPRGRVRDVR